MDREDDQDLLDDSDSDDADFVPEGPESGLSEEEDDSAQVNDKGKKGKRKRTGKSKGRKRKKLDDSDDGSDDDDFTPDVSSRDESVEESKELNEEEEKRRTDELYSAFLSGVKEISSKPSSDKTVVTTKKVYDFAGELVEVDEVVKPKANSNSTNTGKEANSSKNSTTDDNNSVSNSNGVGSSSSTAASGSPAEASVSSTSTSKFPMIKTRVSILSSNPAQIALGNKSGPKKGLSAILSAIQSNKKQKMGTLEKSKLDWQAFKKKAGIEEELATHVKGKDGFVDRQAFLQRTDLRQFEIEKNLRAKQRRNP